MKKQMIHSKKERGVALLFAIGILALMLLTGIAFLANMLLAQKVATNNSTRGQAKMFAQSAISRVAAEIVLYQSNLVNPANDNYVTPQSVWNLGFSDILSQAGTTGDDDRLTLTTVTAPETDSLLSYTDANYVGSNSHASPRLNNLAYSNFRTATNPTAHWIYVHNYETVPTGGTQKLIGRFAYRVLPDESDSRINMFALLGGRNNTPSEITGQVLDPLQNRWGVEISELDASTLQALTSSSGTWDTLRPSATLPFPYDFNTFFGAYFQSLFDITGTDARTAYDRRLWLKRWLTEGKLPEVREAYRLESNGTTAFHHRFNISTHDATSTTGDDWYARFPATLDSTKYNSEDVIDLLAADSVSFNDRNRLTDYTPERWSGLPFLRRLANTPGTFPDLETRRRQIAANFNDYCDADSTPTSDEPSGTWLNTATTGTGNRPTYTGNEKTPYINEVALGFKMVPTVNNTTREVTTTITPEMIVELIDIYGDATTQYQFAGRVINLALEGTVRVAAEIVYSTDAVPETTIWSSNITKDLVLPQATRTANINFADPKYGAGFTEGYLVGNHEFEPVALPAVSFDTDLRDLIPVGGTLVRITIRGVSYEINRFSFQFGPMALASLGNDATGVDFVDWPSSTIERTGLNFRPFASNTELFTRDGIAEADGFLPAAPIDYAETSAANSYRFYLGGFQAVDPRQNLNVSINLTAPPTPAQTDWMVDAQLLTFKAVADGGPSCPLTMDIDQTYAPGSPLLARFRGGECNTYSNPSAPGTAFTAGPFDLETVTDPARIMVSGNWQYLSTAFIADRPMRSPWEIGMIHRGAAWETIRLSGAGQPKAATETTSNVITPADHAPVSGWNSATGTSYADGDAGILDQIKMTREVRSFGKINVNMLSSNATDPLLYDADIIAALLFNLRFGQNPDDLDTVFGAPPNAATGNPITATAAATAATAAFPQAGGPFGLRSQFIGLPGAASCLANAFGAVTTPAASMTKAQQDEIIGKTINLLTSDVSPSNTIRVVIVAQSIQDISGTGVIRFDRLGDPLPPLNCVYNRFDFDSTNNIYYDEITSETKMLVTLDRNPQTSRLVIRNIEYLD